MKLLHLLVSEMFKPGVFIAVVGAIAFVSILIHLLIEGLQCNL